ncbi:hypothetical protein DXG01_011441, partial [Tephrocybe rancida]
SEDEEVKTKNVWLKGHTGEPSKRIIRFTAHSISRLRDGYNSLQSTSVRSANSHPKCTRKVINVGDALEFLSGGFYRATIHRVVQPPKDQQQATRLGVFYFCRSDDDVTLAPLAASPVLKRIGITRRFEDSAAPTMEAWRKGRTSQYGRSDLTPSSEKGVEEETIAGVVVKHYN